MALRGDDAFGPGQPPLRYLLNRDPSPNHLHLNKAQVASLLASAFFGLLPPPPSGLGVRSSFNFVELTSSVIPHQVQKVSCGFLELVKVIALVGV